MNNVYVLPNNSQSSSPIAKKQWIKPEVEVIGNDIINNGSNLSNAEGVIEYYYSGGVLTKLVHFGVS